MTQTLEPKKDTNVPLDDKAKASESHEDSPLIAAAGGSQGKRDAIEVTEEAREKEYTYPSFGSKLFMGEFAADLVYPFPLQSETDRKEADEYIKDLEKFLVENLDADEVDATRTIPKKVIEGLATRGAFALKIPKEYRGMGFSIANYNRIVMKVASYCGSTAVLLSAHQSIGVPQPLKMFGTEAQKKKFFPRFRDGAISAFALTEPEVGSDPARLKTTATLSPDGTHYVLNGLKLWCTNGTIADIIIVMAQTAPKIVRGKERKQISAFILEMNSPGIEIVHRCEFLGLGGIYNGLIKFTDVKIPRENLLGEEGRGLAMALATINVGRLTLPAACTAGAKQCLHIARQWGTERVQWGMPIALHEPGREKIAYITATTLAMEAMTWLTTAWADDGKRDIRIEAAMAKMFCSEALWKIADLTLQLRGGRGYEKATSLKARGEAPLPVERILRDSRVNTILEGSTEIMRLFLAREAMDPHLKRAQNLLNPKASIGEKLGTGFKLLGFYSGWYPKQWWGKHRARSYSEMGPLAKHYAYIEKTSHELASSIFWYMARYREGLEKRQMILGRLMDIGTELFAMAATCSYAIALKKQDPAHANAVDIADYFCAIARRRIARSFYELKHNDDKKMDYLAKNVVNNEMTWLEGGVIPMDFDKTM